MPTSKSTSSLVTDLCWGAWSELGVSGWGRTHENWQIESDPRRCSVIEVCFVSEAPGRTRVTLEHRHIERHGDGWEQMH